MVVVLRLVADAGLVGLLLFTSAGTMAWGRAWALLAVLATGFLGLPLLAGLDVFRWHLLPPPGRWLSGIGVVLFAMG